MVVVIVAPQSHQIYILFLLQTGDQVIEALGLKGRTYEGSMKHLALLSVGNLFFSWLGLLLKQRQQRRIQGNRLHETPSVRTAPLDVNRTTSSPSASFRPIRVPTKARH